MLTSPTKKYADDSMQHRHNRKKFTHLQRIVDRAYKVSRRGVGDFRVRLDVHYAEQRRERNPEKGKGSGRISR